MINLLPFDRREEMLKKYKKRVFVSYIFSIAALVIFFSVFISSLWYVNHLEVKGLQNQMRTLEELKNKQGFTALVGYITSLNKNISSFERLIASEKKTYPALEAVLSKKIQGVSITSLDYVISSDRATGQFSITGIAENREMVLAFSAELQKNPNKACENVTIPIMTYTNRADLPFTITCIMRYEK